MATKKTNNTEKSKLSLTAKIDRMIERENATVKAYASVNIGGAFVIKDIAVVDGQKGMFARMPFRSYKGANGETKYNDIFHPITAEASIPTLPSPSPMRQGRASTTPCSALTVRLWRNPRTNCPMSTKVPHKRCDFFLKSADFAGLSEFFRYPVGRGGKYEKYENARSPPRRTDYAEPCGM